MKFSWPSAIAWPKSYLEFDAKKQRDLILKAVVDPVESDCRWKPTAIAANLGGPDEPHHTKRPEAGQRILRMFKVNIDTTVRIAGCPESGLLAVDFRRSHGIPEAPSNSVRIQVRMESEAVCRRFREYLSDNADLEIQEYGPEVSRPLHAPLNERGERNSFHNYYEVSAECVSRFFGSIQSKETREDAIIGLLSEIEDKMRENASRMSEVIRRHKEKEACEKRERERMDAERKANEERRLKEKAEWIEAYGSQRLKRSFREGINCDRNYFDERMAMDRPGWKRLDDTGLEVNDPRNPPESAFGILDEARKFDPEALLMYAYLESEDEYGEKEREWVGYVAVADFLGHEIVYGAPDIK